MRLLYADDRAPARETAIQEDGTFSFEYVPQDKYILQVSGAGDAQPKQQDPASEGPNPATTVTPEIHYADKEIPLTILEDVSSIAIALPPATPAKPAFQ
jgi:hypothetical protein